MAVLGDRGTGVLDMLIEGFRRSGADMPQPNMSPVGRTPLQQVLNRPEVAISASGNQMVTTMPDMTMAQASPRPMLSDVTRGRILDSNDPMRPVPQPMPIQQAVQREQARMGAPAAPQQSADPMGMGKLASDADRLVKAGAAESTDPSIRQRIQDVFGGRENMLRLAMAFNTMRLQPDAGLTTALTSELKDVRAQSRAQSQRNATANWLRSQKRDDLANLVEQNMIEGKKAIELSMGQTGRVVTSAELRQKFPNIDIEDGLYNLKADGTINKVGGGGVNVNIGPQEGKLSTDFTFLRDAEGNILIENGLPKAVPVPGSPAAQKAEETVEKETGRKVQRQRAGGTVIQDIQRGLDLIPELSSMEAMPGVAGANVRKIAQDIEGTVTNRIAKFKESALSNVGLDTLQQMRENSPTGGALGQVPIQQQQRLEQVLGSLDVTQDLDVLQQNMQRVINIYLDIVYGAKEERQLLMDKGELTAEENAEINGFYYDLPFDLIGRPKVQEIPRPEDIPQELWDVMEDEEKRALQ